MESNEIVLGAAKLVYKFQNDRMLPHIVSGTGFDFVAVKGSLNLDKFPGCEITEVTPGLVVIAYGEKTYRLTPGDDVTIKNIEKDQYGYGSVKDAIGVVWPFVKSDKKKLHISANVRADRCESGFAIDIPIQDFPDGVPVRINGYFNDLYQEYLKPIDIVVNQHDMSIDSEYLKEKVRFDRPVRQFTILGIGLSYASCNLEISLE